MYTCSKLLLLIIMFAWSRVGESITNDCDSNPNGAFLPKSTISSLFSTLCEKPDGRKGGCATAANCGKYGGTGVTHTACTGNNEKCCLFVNKTTKIDSNTCYCLKAKYCGGATFSGLCPGDSSVKCCADETNQLSSCPANPAVSLTNFKKVYTYIKSQRAAALWPYINTGFQDIGTSVMCHVKSAFLAQVFIETFGLLWTEELASGADYEGRTSLGNTETGDGPRFKGRGMLQLTGRNNYNAYKSASGHDVISDPEQVAFPYIASKSSAWFWTSNKLNPYADGTLLGFHRLVAKINGPGMNHLKERVDKWKAVSNILSCGAISDGVGDDCDNGWGSCVVDTTCKTEIRPKCNGKACCPKDPKTVKCCKKSASTNQTTISANTVKPTQETPSTKASIPKSVNDCMNMGRNGDCEFYKCANKHFGCGNTDYFIAYGHRYCNRFSDHYSSFDDKGRKWVDAVRKCLMQKIMDIYPLEMSCDELKTFAFESHPDCYVNSADGFCNVLNGKNSLAFWKVFQFKDFTGDDADLSKEQIKQTLKSCYCETNEVSVFEDLLLKIDRDEFKQVTVDAEMGVDALADSYAASGDCRLYGLFESRFPCSSWRDASHIDDFELKLCEEYDDNMGLFERKGHWVKNVRKCMMKEILVLYKSSKIKCTEMLSKIFKIREKCYKENSFCAFEEKRANQLGLSRVTSWGLRNILTYYGKSMTVYKDHLKYLRCQCHDKSLTKYKFYESENGFKMKLRR